MPTFVVRIWANQPMTGCDEYEAATAQEALELASKDWPNWILEPVDESCPVGPVEWVAVVECDENGIWNGDSPEWTPDTGEDCCINDGDPLPELVPPPRPAAAVDETAHYRCQG